MPDAFAKEQRADDKVRIGAVTFLAVLSIFPILVMLSTSLKTQSQVFSGDFSFFMVPTFENYRSVLEGRFLGYLGNSIVVSVIATVLTLVFGTMCAYSISRFRFTGRSPIAMGTLLVRTIPPAVLAIPVYFILTPLHLDGLAGLTITYIALNLPFTIWLLYGFIEQVPTELEEAATVDGCGPYRLFFTLILPLLKPGLAAAAIFTFRIAWNELVLASILTNRTSRTLPYGVYLFITDVGIDWGQLMAAGMLVALPPLIFTFVAAQQIITGLTAGAVKG
ncbi:MAG TPA: carbohydrate ABC transporter permease [Bradyrhizobium sp.]|jgi:multiple sugar transport system permease protein|nr:carbohydrate ABC transporter permease [Bradyrhizobium sp.]